MAADIMETALLAGNPNSRPAVYDLKEFDRVYVFAR